MDIWITLEPVKDLQNQIFVSLILHLLKTFDMADLDYLI